MPTLENLSAADLAGCENPLLLRLLLPKHFDNRLYGLGESQLVKLCTGSNKALADRNIPATIGRHATGNTTWSLEETDAWLNQLATSSDKKSLLALMMTTLNQESAQMLASIILRDTGCGIGPVAARAAVNYQETKKQIKPALATAKPINDKLVKGGVWVERKYDGERIQIHSTNGQLSAWSRQFKPLAINTDNLKFAKSDFVIDGELVLAMNDGTDVIPFGVKDSNATEWIFLFDCMSVDGYDQTSLPIEQRRVALASIGACGRVSIVEPILISDANTLHEMMRESKRLGHEGFVVKRQGSPYRSGYRDWVKLKHSVSRDLVPVGAWKGKGKLANYYSVFQMADEDGKPVCKVAGLTISMLKQLMTQYSFVLDESARGKEPPFRLVGPQQIWEIEGQSLTKNSIRHPRFLRVRTDLLS